MTQPRQSTHDCPAGCGAQVDHQKFACTTDWYRLPSELRARITSTYRRELVREHRAAMAEAVRWYGEHPRELDPE